MKKVIIALFCCLISVGAFAQKPVNIGVRAGWAYSNLKFKETNLKRDANGFAIGAFARINLKKLYVEPGVNYAFMKGASDSDQKINYIQVPVMVGYHIIDAKVVKLRGFIGPEADFLAKDAKGAWEDVMKKLAWNGRVGVGVDVWKITCDLDYKFAIGKTGDGVEKGKGVNLTVGFKIF